VSTIEANLNSVIFYRTYLLDEAYSFVKEHAPNILGKHLESPGLYKFDDKAKTLTFKSERLVPVKYSGRPKMMLLFSNPHPRSVHLGMFLSGSSKEGKSLFWQTMHDSSCLRFIKDSSTPQQRADLCFNVDYKAPFDFIFYPYYVFPTRYPDHLPKVFGKAFFENYIESEAKQEFTKHIQDLEIDGIISFNKEIFNRVAKERIKTYINQMVEGELFQSTVKIREKEIPIYQTFPTGWRYHPQMKQIRANNLSKIVNAILQSFS